VGGLDTNPARGLFFFQSTHFFQSTQMSDQFELKWIDYEREPTVTPNPAYPLGVDIDSGKRPACRVELPYPARRVGAYIIECTRCHTNAMITTAGRPDDPRSMMLPCKLQ
jgi:hypothetical protein